MYGKAIKWNNISNIELNFWAMFCWHCRFHNNNNLGIFSKSSHTKYSSMLTGYTVVFTLAGFEKKPMIVFLRYNVLNILNPQKCLFHFSFLNDQKWCFTAWKTHIYIPSLRYGSVLSMVVKKNWQATFVITHFSILTQKIRLLVWAQKSVLFKLKAAVYKPTRYFLNC